MVNDAEVRADAGGRPPLADRDLTYPFRGATLIDHEWRHRVPDGYRTYEKSARLGSGEEFWTETSTTLMAWGIKTRSGFDVTPTMSVNLSAARGLRFWLAARFGPWRVREPVEVIDVIDQPLRRGFAYGTLEGHPVSGEELLAVERRPDDTVWLTLRSATGPGKGRWRLAFPLLLVAQVAYRHRYLRALVDQL